ncbi:alpha-glucosidase [bacterium A37T11]|nr:alpha-glucosidase [bacterium A37T11]
MKAYPLYLGLVILVCLSFSACNTLPVIQDPMGYLKVKLSLTKDRQLQYNLTNRQGDTLIYPSNLGVRVNQMDLGAHIDKIQLKEKHAAADYMDYLFMLQQDDFQFELQIRVYGDAMAYRYRLSQPSDVRISGELSSWTFPQKSRVWYFERNSDWKLKSYAGLWMSTSVDSLSIVSTEGPIQGKPLVVETSRGEYISVSEAALYDYSGMRLKALGNRQVSVNFTEKQFSVNGSIHTPWRVTFYAKNLNGLIQMKNVLYDLNPKPNASLFADTAYIKPGRSVWSWWSKDAGYMSWQNEIKFIDYADQLTFEYVLLDEGWEKWPNKWQMLANYCRLARLKHIGVWVWKHSDEVRDPIAMNAFLDSVQHAVAVGVKVDFMNSEAKELIDFEKGFLEACAKRKLMVDLHGCQVPTGEARRFPNEMTREGVRGMELNTMGEPLPAWHNTALPFTRMIVGHADYTPMSFSKPGRTTWAHQLATAYMYDSPIMVMAENPGFILKNDSLRVVIPFIKEMPVTWDSTWVMPESKIGRLAVMIRKKGKVYYAVVLNGMNRKQKWQFKPLFLADNEVYLANELLDKPGSGRGVILRKESINKDVVIPFDLEPNGGLVVKIEKEINN